MDRIQKALAKLSAKEHVKLIELTELIIARRFTGMDLKKLKAHANAYRIRKGDFRVIFTIKNVNDIRIIALERRADTTYKNI